ncbi:MAG: hypothetical protein KGZ50_09510 [Peptococcaceae bacterium]|nr:hypothetical protein [Peptococcaceae bacterium]
MPLPLIPVLLWGGAALLAATGIKKGVDASNDFDKAKEIGEAAQQRHEKALTKLDKNRAATQRDLEHLSELKIRVFTTQIKYLVDALKKGRSKISDFNLEISTDQLNEYERLVLGSFEIEKGLASGAVGGALAAMGAYGTVGTVATASTGAAISGLSGVAATNATLAWLGGGALSAGGFGMAGGMVALGGIALGPALAIGGFMMAGKAEKAVTEARSYEAEVDVAIAEIEKASIGLKAIRSNAAELQNVIERLVDTFEKIKVPNANDEAAFQRMVMVGKGIKEVLEIKIMSQDGKAINGLDASYSGFLEITGSEVA